MRNINSKEEAKAYLKSLGVCVLVTLGILAAYLYLYSRG